jgi:penicillin-binding protein 1C
MISMPRASLAMLVADAGAREIRAAYAGAWGDQARSGALDLTMAVRSPGLALKPFIYTLAFADGIAAPDTVLPDLPSRFGGYAPENFDRGFAGSVTAADALRRSLNLPAVALLDRVGPLRFAATLRSAGTTLRLPRALIRPCPWHSAVSASHCARQPGFMPLWRPMGPGGRCI